MKILKLILLFLFVFTGLFAQKTVINGVITAGDSEESIPGVNIIIQGTHIGTTTDSDGNFSLEIPEEHLSGNLQISYVGYLTEIVEIAGQTEFKLTLTPDLQLLDEIVVVGYGTQKKIELTGAVSSVKSDDMVQIAASDFTKSLQGLVAGVSIVESSGRPGDQAIIQIRGLGSISSSTSPLFVVDGIPFESNPNIPAEEIESVDILKDGAAAAVYGTRASNGVILITTKRGQAGKTKVGFTAYYGIQNITSGTPLLNTQEHIYVDEMNQRVNASASPILYFNPNAIDYETDWIEYITNDNAPIQNYNLSISGGVDNFSINVNANYFNQGNILINSGYDRFTTRVNTDYNKGRFSAFVSLGVSHSKQEVEPWALYDFAIWQGPYRPTLEELESSGNAVYYDGKDPDHLGYFARQLGNVDARKTNSFNVAANLKFEILKGLNYQMNIGSNFWNYQKNYWQPQWLIYDRNRNLNVSGSREQAVLEEEFQNSNKLTLENILSYNKTIGKHSFSLLAAYTIEHEMHKTVNVEKRDFISNDVRVFDGGRELTGISGDKEENAIIGKLFRVQYNYGDRYLFSGSIRHDGSSKFGKDNRYALFPGVSAGWNISEESFMQNIGFINNLKLRASYAEVGSEGIDPYLYAGYIDANIDYIFGPESADYLTSGAIQRGYSNPDVKWEANISRNIGLDLLMWDGRFGLTVDVYKNNKSNMLLSVLLPPSTGTNVPNDWANQYNSKISNVGNMVNQGIEIQAYYKQRTEYGLGWQIRGVFTKNNNEITSLGSLTSIPLSDSKPGQFRAEQQDITTYMRPGYEAASFFLIPTDGIIKTNEELEEVRTYMPNARLGDLKYIDTSGDGKIDDEDRQDQGSGMPLFESGLMLDLTYRGFDFGTHLILSYGNKVFNGSKLFAYSFSRHKDMYYMWTPANPNSDIMSARTNSEHDNFRSRADYFLEDGSFLRFRTISLGYTIPQVVFKGHIDKMRVYITGQNLFTFTKYEGYDPEIGGTSVGNRGIDRGNYPITRTIIAGIQVEF